METGIEIETSTDTVEQVKAALEPTIEIEESQPEETEAEAKPVVKPAKEAAQETETETEEETEETEEAEESAEEEEETVKPKKAAPPTVPRSRLNEEIRKRRDAESRLEEARRSKPAAATKEEPAEEAKPQFYCGRPKPMIKDFLDDPEKYPDPYASFGDVMGEWHADERDAKREYETRRAEAEEAREAQVAPYKALLPAMLERRPDYLDVVKASDVQISAPMQDFCWNSKIGPDIFLHFAENPEVAGEIMAIGTIRGQGRAMDALEAELAAELGVDLDETEEEQPKPKAKTKAAAPPPKKIVTSKAPPPIVPLKPAGKGPKTLQELAGPEDKTGIDIEFNPEYERAVKAQRRI